jgi:hypothetical protein
MHSGQSAGPVQPIKPACLGSDAGEGTRQAQAGRANGGGRLNEYQGPFAQGQNLMTGGTFASDHTSKGTSLLE